MDLRDALAKLIMGDGRLADTLTGANILALAICSAGMGLIVVSLDWTIYTVKRRSVLNLSYGAGFTTGIRLLLLWGVGAGLGGLLGFGSEMLQPTRAACIGFGVAWPLVLPRIIDQVGREIQEPQQLTSGGQDGDS